MKQKIAKLGIIGGSGVEELLFISGFKTKFIFTKYGKVKVKLGAVEGKSVIFLNRHGDNYRPPSQVNYRANLFALAREKVEVILATAAVGSSNLKMKPGDFALLTDFIDFTKKRIETFSPRSFVDLTEPYNSALNKKILKAASLLKYPIHSQATYVCTEGPRFETKAEIRILQKLGADLVGMTQVPEVVLAAEMAIPYAAIAVITNFAAGLSPRKISSPEVMSMMKKKNKTLSRLLLSVIKNL